MLSFKTEIKQVEVDTKGSREPWLILNGITRETAILSQDDRV